VTSKLGGQRQFAIASLMSGQVDGADRAVRGSAASA
jgi:hypothetical protein